ncbi:MAG: rhomboid family intramembrane serine protease [Burkholderiaceae bacterium]
MQEFANRLHQATPTIWVTKTLISINVLAFLTMALAGINPLEPTARELLDVGGNFLPATVLQPWRLMSATILHAGLLHLGFNMFALYQMGGIAERFYGNTQFLIIYLLAGLFGSLASLFFSASEAVSVGASGAVFGVSGAILAAVVTARNKLPPMLVTSMSQSMLLFVGYSLFMGFTTSFVDNSAHIGGLVSGFLTAWIMVERFDWQEFRRRAVLRATIAIALAAVAATTMWSLAVISPS